MLQLLSHISRFSLEQVKCSNFQGEINLEQVKEHENFMLFFSCELSSKKIIFQKSEMFLPVTTLLMSRLIIKDSKLLRRFR